MVTRRLEDRLRQDGDKRYGPQYSIYVMNADGSGQTRLTAHTPALHRRPSAGLSSDGQKIAYTSSIGDDEEGGSSAASSSCGFRWRQPEEVDTIHLLTGRLTGPRMERGSYLRANPITTMVPDGTGLADIVLRTTFPFGGESLEAPRTGDAFQRRGRKEATSRTRGQFARPSASSWGGARSSRRTGPTASANASPRTPADPADLFDRVRPAQVHGRFAHPDQPRRHAADDRVCRHVLRDDCT